MSYSGFLMNYNWQGGWGGGQDDLKQPTSSQLFPLAGKRYQ